MAQPFPRSFFQSDDAKWFTAAAFNRVKINMVGVQIGLVNITRISVGASSAF